MTVKELIEQLQQFPPDLEVEIEYDSGYGHSYIEKVYQDTQMNLNTKEEWNVIQISSGSHW